MKTHTFIYALIDPESREVHYIGKADDMKARLRNHLHKSALEIRCRRTSWIKGLLKQGKKPLMVMLEEVGQEHWKQRECYWIAFYRGIGAHLMNTAEGGSGGMKSEWITPEMRGNMRAAQLGKKRSEESRKKQGDAIRGRKRGEAFSLKMSLVNKGQVIAPHTRAAQLASAEKEYIVTAPDGTETTIKNLKQFCHERGLNYPIMNKIANGWFTQTHHKGWACRKPK